MHQKIAVLSTMSVEIKKIYLYTSGRYNRKSYLLYGVLPFLVLGAVLGFLNATYGILDGLSEYLILPFIVWPLLAVQIKRWHDIGLSGWFSVLTFLPYVGHIIACIIGLIPGNNNKNRFGSPSNQLDQSL